MADLVSESIETWFDAHDGDGEFVLGRRSAPYSVVGPKGPKDNVILTTKPVAVSAAMYGGNENSGIGVIGRYGLPNREDMEWVKALAGSRMLLFLGDLDPVDLLVFAWLRASLYPNRIVHFGINDSFLDTLGIAPAKYASIPLAPSERKACSLFPKVFPDFRDRVGARCERVINAGEKLEFDAIVGARDISTAITRAATSNRLT